MEGLSSLSSSKPRLQALESQGPQILEGKFRAIGDTRNEENRKRLEYWKGEVLQCAREQGWISMTVAEVRAQYTNTQGKYPLGIGRALVELEREGTLVREETLFAPPPSLLWTLVTSPIKWAFSPSSGGASNNNNANVTDPGADERFVLKGMLERVGKDVVALLEGKMAREQDLVAAARAPSLQDGRLLIKWLGERNMIRWDEEVGAYAVGVEGVSDLERTLFRVRATLIECHDRENELESRLASFKQEARACAKSNRRRALEMMKRAKIVDGALSTQYGKTSNVQQVLTTLEGTLSNMRVVEALRQGTSAMKAAMESSGLSVESVEAVLDQHQEIKDKNDEVDAALGGASNVGVADDAELEQELANLLKEGGGDGVGVAEDDELVSKLESLSVGAKNNSNTPTTTTTAKKQLVYE